MYRCTRPDSTSRPRDATSPWPRRHSGVRHEIVRGRAQGGPAVDGEAIGAASFARPWRLSLGRNLRRATAPQGRRPAPTPTPTPTLTPHAARRCKRRTPTPHAKRSRRERQRAQVAHSGGHERVSSRTRRTRGVPVVLVRAAVGTVNDGRRRVWPTESRCDRPRPSRHQPGGRECLEDATAPRCEPVSCAEVRRGWWTGSTGFTATRRAVRPAEVRAGMCPRCGRGPNDLTTVSHR